MRNVSRETVIAAAQDDQQAQTEIYKHYRLLVMKVASKFVPIDDVEDITQEVFIQVFRKLRSFKFGSSLSTWIYRVTVNQCLMKIRTKAYKHGKSDVSIDEMVSLWNDKNLPNNLGAGTVMKKLGREDERQKFSLVRPDLIKAIGRLAPGYRTIFCLHEIDGYSMAEISEMLGCSIGNCKSQLWKARKHVRRTLTGKVKPLGAAA